MFIDLYINVGVVIQSELAYEISFFVILTIFSLLWVLSDQIIFEYHLKEFIIFNFQVKERYNSYLKQEYKKLVDNFDSLDKIDKIRLFDIINTQIIQKVYYSD
ncbi:hypothetical protein [Mesomycoplasma hyorhinis]|nr:hypothetical protein [Mesomycoplasma hyorhinis]